MANISNNMIITDEALSQISRMLINEGSYNNNNVVLMGSTSVINGIASNFSEVNYVVGNRVNLYNDYGNTVIEVKGYLIPEATSCAFKLGNLSLVFNQDTCTVYSGEYALVQVTDEILSTERELAISLTLTQSSISLKLIVDNESQNRGTLDDYLKPQEIILFDTAPLSEPINLSNFHSLIIGNDSEGSTKYWRGYLDLDSFNIFQDDLSVYSTASSPTITFSQIIISDGKYPLADDSDQILNHMYEYQIKEITRTNNNLLLTATIDEKAYLTIREIGLYCTFGDGTTHLFSTLGGMSLDKREDIGYNLIIRVNLDVNVVNTAIFPEIVVKEEEYPKLTDFFTIRDVYAYATTNLERMIKTNALGIGTYFDGFTINKNGTQFLPVRPKGIDDQTFRKMTERKPVGVGYNKAQVYCRLQDKISNWKDNFNATFNYACLQSNIEKSSITETVFHPYLLTTYGDAVVEDNGEGSVFMSSALSYNELAEAAEGDSENFGVINQSFVSDQGDFYVNEDLQTMFSVGISRIVPTLFTPHPFDEWDFQVSFQTQDENFNACIINFTSLSSNQPLVLSLGGGHCYLQLGNTNSVIYYDSLFPTQNFTKYYVRGEYKKGTYSFSCSVDENTWTEVLHLTSNETIGDISDLLIGAQYIESLSTYANPYTGTLYLDKFDFNFYKYSEFGALVDKINYNFASTVTTYLETLKSYFHFPEFLYNAYRVNNLGSENSSSYIRVLDNFFIGYNDNIDFKNERGFSLCLKVDFGGDSNDGNTKIVLAKGDLDTENFYFILKLEGNNNLIFEYHSDDRIFTLQKEISSAERDSYFNRPISIAITCDGAASPTFTMYRNGKKIASGQASNTYSANISKYTLTNTLSRYLASEAQNFIKDIICVEGVLSDESLYYISTILDTVI